MKIAGFNEYLERMLIEMASRQSNQLKSHDIQKIHDEKFADCPPTWLEIAIREMSKRGWGVDGAKHGRHGNFWVEGAGLAEAQHLREKYRKRGVKDFFAAFSRSDWISLAAFAVSIAAVLKGN